jgi:transposase-like protein
MNKATEGKIKKKAKLLDILSTERGATITYCAKKLGVDFTTIFYWRKEDEEFNKKVDELLTSQRNAIVDLAENKLMKKINEDDTTCIIFALKTIGRERGYSERNENININYNKEITIADISDEDIKRYKAIRDAEKRKDKDN